ncbi:hypothetical protein NDR77_24710 [Pseudomonas aeruginosa]|uniref:Uncharacterized protein n=2 Tax=root TaxID=1 RepID=A0A0S2SYV3_9CAUD|nr:hypothetical protein [Pseudomonas aeruginosa]YP_009187480.1 hypothetical protein AU162_gp083 [Pseudomonas phage YMC11/02/R656]ALP47904.1 hypothetical protein BPPAER656_00830 [Pseudomonas phage YMC11/02/R656]AYZ83531.1 hypothetical protein EGY27_12010 [Pseudomonas aeruginosa]KJC14112.1 hypothetical protein TO65_30370 [Pseudomonas aeruginosa]KYO85138.1 hypothetical protein LT19_05172 [Pseudomonas aeruginosa]MBO7955765.1 hypothetical protein [Pseudomonas aeruginosa]
MSKAIDAILESYQRSISDGEKRAIAVAAALQIIEAKVSNAPTNNAVVENEFNNLNKYADQILAALKGE